MFGFGLVRQNKQIEDLTDQGNGDQHFSLFSVLYRLND